MDRAEVENFAHVMIEAKTTIKYCSNCFNISSSDPCEICASSSRNKEIICVVSEAKDLMAIEKTNEYNGLYIILQGLNSPIEGIGPEDIKVKELFARVHKNDIKEIILSLNPSV